MKKMLTKENLNEYLETKKAENSGFGRVAENEVLTIPEGVKEIGADTFSYIQGLRIVNLPKSLQTIYTQAFMYCVDLEQINCPSPAVKIDIGAFTHCDKLKKINMSMDIPNNDLLFVFNLSTEQDTSIPKSLRTFKLGKIVNGQVFNKTYNACPVEILPETVRIETGSTSGQYRAENEAE